MGNCSGKPKTADSSDERVEMKADMKVSIVSPPPPPHAQKPEATNYPVYVGKYDYDSRTDDDLSFRKGDLMYIISTDEGDWWFAKSKEGGREGYIPSNYVAEWKSLDAEE